MFKKIKVKNSLAFIIVMLLSIFLELALFRLQVREENIYLLFIVSIIIIIIETESLFYGILGSFSLLLSFNYFITAPYYSFDMDDPNYYVSFIIFTIVTFIINYLVLRLRGQINLSNANSKKLSLMYNYSTQLLNCKDEKQIFEITMSTLRNNIENELSDFCYSTDEKSSKYSLIKESTHNDEIIGKGQYRHNCLDYMIFPITSNLKEYGAIIVECKDKEMDNESKLFVENIIDEMIISLDKNYIIHKQQKDQLEYEKEKFKTSLLRGLSHDIKTPLTLIQSGSQFLMQSYQEIDDGSKREIIKDIYKESCDLSIFVSNLLNMTRLSEDGRLINRQLEMVDSVFASINEKARKYVNDISLQFSLNNPEAVVYADVSLLSQVFTNLIDNAIKHGKKLSKIRIECIDDEKEIVFKVSDNGGGVNKKIADKIFDDFYSLTSKQDKTRSHGLGLSICKAIVEAHGGEIRQYNNEMNGATFEFNIPKGDDI